jgi:hypothetical protein
VGGSFFACVGVDGCMTCIGRDSSVCHVDGLSVLTVFHIDYSGEHIYEPHTIHSFFSFYSPPLSRRHLSIPQRQQNAISFSCFAVCVCDFPSPVSARVVFFTFSVYMPDTLRRSSPSYLNILFSILESLKMCYQIVERYAVCQCLYHMHAIDACSSYGHRAHTITVKTILVGYTCPTHASQQTKTPQSAASDSGYSSGSHRWSDAT